MKYADIPTKFPIPFAAEAGVGYIRPIPVDSQIGIHNGYASLTDGYPPLNFVDEGAGGVPPWGQDTNGILNQITLWSQWQNAGGGVKYDADFATAISGYPKYTVLVNASTVGSYWVNTVDDNDTDPDASGAGWSGYKLIGLDQAAYKQVSSNSEPKVASIHGATVANHFAVFNDTAGTVKDGGAPGTAAFKAVSSNALATVASVSGATVVGHFPVFIDTAGTIADGGTLSLGTAASKDASNNSDAVVASVHGTIVANRAAEFSDTNGSVRDSGFVLDSACAKAVSDDTKATVASVAGGTTTGDVAIFTDGNGTIGNGFTPGTSAHKAASSNSETTVASVHGATGVNHAAEFNDTNGTIRDSGFVLDDACTRAASDVTRTTVASVYAAGTITPANIAVFHDVNGTVEDGGYSIADLIAAFAIPSGTTMWFTSTAVPTGWLEADGIELLRASYPGLNAVAAGMGYAAPWGDGDGSTTFNLPDLRGYFVRAWNHGSTPDPGRTFGSVQADDNKAHTHEIVNGGSSGLGYLSHGDNLLANVSTLSSGGTEARPKNVALLPCIKI